MKPQAFDFYGHQVRFVMIENKKYAVGKDGALAIGYKNPQKAIKDHVKDKYKRGERIVTPFGEQEMTLISEPGLYQLAAQSKLPKAEKFQDWLFETVLPQINATGSYTSDQYEQPNVVPNEPNYGKFANMIPTNMGEALQLAANQQKEIETLKPKAEKYELYHSKSHTWTMTQIGESYGLQAWYLNNLLSDMGIQYKRGNHWYLYAKYKKSGLTIYCGMDRSNVVYQRWTDKGKELIEFILNRLGFRKNNTQPTLF